MNINIKFLEMLCVTNTAGAGVVVVVAAAEGYVMHIRYVRLPLFDMCECCFFKRDSKYKLKL